MMRKPNVFRGEGLRSGEVWWFKHYEGLLAGPFKTRAEAVNAVERYATEPIGYRRSGVY